MADPATAPALTTAGGRGRRVLVVDDEQPLARLVGTYLQRDGFEVALAFDGEAALTLAREVDPDAVVLDLGLPGLDGLEFCRRHRCGQDLPDPDAGASPGRHHMARTELAGGSNPEATKLAQSSITSQTEEISQMRQLAAGIG